MVKRLLFICVGNAFRSQVAEGFARAQVGRRALVRSGGLKPAEALDPIAVQLMAEVGIDISRHEPKVVDATYARRADRIIVMGCDPTEACPAEVLDRVEEWEVPDPKGLALAKARNVRDAIRGRVAELVGDL